MLAHHFVLIISILIGVGLVPMLIGAYYNLLMQNNRKPNTPPPWEMRGRAFPNSPANFTETGLIYRHKAINAQLAFCGWVLISMIILHFL